MFLKVWRQCSCRFFSKSSSWKNIEKAKPTPNTDTVNIGEMSNTGVPKEWEKRLLVMTGKYKSYEDVPNRISYDTMNKAKSIMRIRVGNLMMVTILVACACVVYYGKQKAKEGDSIVKRVMERDEQIRAEARAEKNKMA